MEPKAIRSQKRLMQKWENCSAEEGIMAGVDAYAEAYEDGGREPKAMIGS
jgi:enoyl-CoA hydratase